MSEHQTPGERREEILQSDWTREQLAQELAVAQSAIDRLRAEVADLRDEHQTLSARPERLLQRREVEELLGISRRHLWELTKQGALPHVRLGRGAHGGHPRYAASDVAEFIRAHRRAGSPP